MAKATDSDAIGNENMKQVTTYEEERTETPEELEISITNYMLELNEFPLSMYENLVDEIKKHTEQSDYQNLRIRIRGNMHTVSLASIKECGNEMPYLYMSINSGVLHYSTVELNKDPKFLIRMNKLKDFTSVCLMSSNMSIFIKNRGE